MYAVWDDIQEKLPFQILYNSSIGMLFIFWIRLARVLENNFVAQPHVVKAVLPKGPTRIQTQPANLSMLSIFKSYSVLPCCYKDDSSWSPGEMLHLCGEASLSQTSPSGNRSLQGQSLEPPGYPLDTASDRAITSVAVQFHRCWLIRLSSSLN